MKPTNQNSRAGRTHTQAMTNHRGDLLEEGSLWTKTISCYCQHVCRRTKSRELRSNANPDMLRRGTGRAAARIGASGERHHSDGRSARSVSSGGTRREGTQTHTYTNRASLPIPHRIEDLSRAYIVHATVLSKDRCGQLDRAIRNDHHIPRGRPDVLRVHPRFV